MAHPDTRLRRYRDRAIRGFSPDKSGPGPAGPPLLSLAQIIYWVAIRLNILRVSIRPSLK